MWAKNPLSSAQSSSPRWGFQKLYAALDAAWMQEQEEADARRGDDGPTETRNISVYPGHFFQGQGIYGRERKPNSKSSAPRSWPQLQTNQQPGKNGTDKFGKPRICHNCSSADHFIRQCYKPRNVVRSIVNMLRDNPGRMRESFRTKSSSRRQTL
jgi:hypothetical protein